MNTFVKTKINFDSSHAQLYMQDLDLPDHYQHYYVQTEELTGLDL